MLYFLFARFKEIHSIEYDLVNKRSIKLDLKGEGGGDGEIASHLGDD